MAEGELSIGGASELVEALSGGREAQSGRRSATVLSVDPDGTCWVRLAAGADKTPCASSIADVSAGDTVTVEVRGGRASIVGNETARATSAGYVDSGLASVAESAATARDMAASAAESAERARETADGVEAIAVEARETAEGIAGTAEQAKADAERAADDAESAKGSAESALSSAAAAEAGLGRVIDVVGVLDWVEGHARLTSDTSAVDGKDYYSRDAATGTMSTADPSGMYAPTADQTVDPSKTYYERTGAEEGPDAYTEVAEPADSEIGSYYERGNPALLGLYELDESVQRYVMSYLALVDGVLKLSSGGTARVELSADALRFVAPDGNVAASVEVGEDGRSVMRITRSVALEDVQFGDWKFYQRANGNMAIKWMGAR